MRHVRLAHGEINMTPPISIEEVTSVAEVTNDELKIGERDRSYDLAGPEINWPDPVAVKAQRAEQQQQ